MKIAMIGHKDFPSRSGGVEVVVLELASRLASKGHDVTVYNRGRRKKGEAMGVTVRGAFTFQKESLNALVSSFAATFDAIFRKYDIIHYHAIGPSVPLLIAHLFGKKTVSTVHGLNWRCDKWSKFACAYLKLGEKIAARFSDGIVTLSQEMYDYFLETYARETTLIQNAVSPVVYKECGVITEKFGLHRKDYILYLGRLSPEKGVQDLVEGYLMSNTDKKLVIAGQVTQTDFVKELVSLASRSERILFTGFVEGDTMRELYSNAALYVLPSHTEGLALTLLEAMSCGARCLVSDIPENTAVLKDFGHTFRVRDPAALAQAMETALALPDDPEKMKRQIEYIAENYSYDAVVSAHENLYAEIMKR